MGERNLIMAGVVREGDVNILGGVCLNGVASVLVNGRPIAVPGMIVTPHPPCPFLPTHCISATSKGGLLGAAISFGFSFLGGAIGEAIGPIGSTVSEFGPVQPIFTADQVGSAVSSAAGSAAGSLLGSGGGGGGVVLAAGKPVIVRGDHDKCICPRSSCSGDVQIG